MIQLPKCCVYCKIRLRGNPENQCAPENLMTAKMSSKCPKFKPRFSREAIPINYEYAMKKYKLGYEND